MTFGKCPNCKKTITNPLTHACAPRSDFKRRKKAHEKAERDRGPQEAAAEQAHDYTACADNGCKRSLCVAYKTGWQSGDEAGYERGWQQGHERGFKEGYAQGYPDGIAACPRDHK